MIEYKFLNKYNFWPIPYKYYAPFSLKDLELNKNSDIINIVWESIDKQHENRPVKHKNLTLLEARNIALDVLNKHEKDRLKYNLDEHWSENRELNSSENNRQ